MEKSSYKSPIYNKIEAINCWDICAQEINPNSTNNKSFGSLQQSIFNSGYLLPVNIVLNPEYDQSLDTTYGIDFHNIHLEDNKSKIVNKLNILINSEDEKSCSGTDISFSTEFRNKELRKQFKYIVIDGQQRSSVIRLGAMMLLSKNLDQIDSNIRYWSNEKIDFNPGKTLLQFLAWRESFKVPSLIINNTSIVDSMSKTVLMNSAKGDHRFDTVREIVYLLINEYGVDRNWISKNLKLDLDSVDRILQVHGLKSYYQKGENEHFDISWSPEKSYSYKQKLKWYLNREALYYLNSNNISIPRGTSRNQIQDLAIENGWDRDKAISTVRQMPVVLNEYGIRQGKGEGALINGFIPDLE